MPTPVRPRHPARARHRGRSLLLGALAIGGALVALGATAGAADPPQFGVSAHSVAPGDVVTFTANDDACGPALGTSCVWHFGDGSTVSTADAATTHAYAAGPQHSYVVTLGSDDGVNGETPLTGEDTISVDAAPQVGPIAGPTSAITGHPVTYSASPSDADSDPLSLAWSVTGGTIISGQGTSSVDVRFTSAGTRQVSLTADDGLGGTATGSTTVAVTADHVPSTDFEPSVSEPFVLGHTVSFSAAQASPDQDNDTVSYQWSVSGGTIVGSSSQPTMTASVTGPSSMRVTLTVNDGISGAHSSPQQTFQVVPATAADFDFSPKPAVAGEPLDFEATNHVPGSVYTWTDRVDGGQPQTLASGAGAWSLVEPLGRGTHVVTLTITDGVGGVRSYSLPAFYVDARPVAWFTVPAQPTSGQPLTFVSASTDVDDASLACAWTVDDVPAPAKLGSPCSLTTTLGSGTHTVALTVTDGRGVKSTATVPVTVDAPPAPPAPPAPAPAPAPPAVTTPIVKKSAPSKKAKKAKSSAKTRSAKASAPKLLSPFPVIRLAGAVRRHGAYVRLFAVKAPKGARVSITCKKGCPRKKVALVAATKKKAKANAKTRTALFPSLKGTYRDGAVLEVRVTKAKTIGKFTRITFRAGKSPKRVDRCLWPGATKPRACPSKSKKAR